MTVAFWNTLNKQKIISQPVPVKFFAWVIALSGLLFITASLLQIRMIKRIDERQAVKYHELRKHQKQESGRPLPSYGGSA